MSRGRFQNFFFIVRFCAIMHRTTIVQNKILSIICSCFFFVRRIFIGLVWGRCSYSGLTQNYFSLSIFISQGKKKDHSTQNCMHNNDMIPDFQFSFSFIFSKILKNVIKKTCQNNELYI